MGLELMKRLNSLMPESFSFLWGEIQIQRLMMKTKMRINRAWREKSLKHFLWENRAACWEDTNLWPKGTKDWAEAGDCKCLTVNCWHWMKWSPLTGLGSSSLVGGLALFSSAVHLYLHEWVLLNPVATGLAGRRSTVCVWAKTRPFQSCAGWYLRTRRRLLHTIRYLESGIWSSTDPVRKAICGSHEAKEEF